MLLALLEVLILFASAFAGIHIYVANTATDTSAWSDPVFQKAVGFSGAVFSAMLIVGLYWHYQEHNLIEIFARVVLGFVLGLIAVVAVCHTFSIQILPIDAFFDIVGISLIGVLCIRAVYYRLSRSDTLKQRILVLGAGSATRSLLSLERTDVEVCYYSSMPDRVKDEVQQGRSYRGKSLLETVRANNVGEIVVALDEQRNRVPIDGLLECKLEGVAITGVSDFIERRFGKIDLSTLNPGKIIFSDGFRVTSLQRFLKRIFDVLVSVLLGVIMLPVMVLAALAILIESRGRGPIFYTQERVGEHGHLFKVIKFRSMRTDAEKSGVPQYAQENDPRVTKVGRILRDLRIDEIPQIINVLCGEMSLVGPRPERSEFVQQYLTSIPYYGLRHEIKPGISGWAQISYAYGSGEQDAIEKLQYDLYYLKHFSLLLDMNIILQTAHIVLSRKGVR